MNCSIQVRRLNGNYEEISIDEEEPFTLETYRSLLDQYWSSGKSLIIARVQSEGEKPFFYLAHHLNKILFRKYGPNSEYLFRLYSNNPLTNTEIQGNVDYFKCPIPKDFPKKPVKKSPSVSSTCLKRLAAQSIGSSKDQLKILDLAGPPLIPLKNKKKSQSISLDSLIRIKSTNSNAKHLSVPDVSIIQSSLLISTDTLDKLITETQKNFETMPSLNNNSISKKTLPDTNFYCSAIFIGNDDEFMHNAQLRRIFKENALIDDDVILFDMPEDVMINEGIFPATFDLNLLSDFEFIQRLHESLLGESISDDFIRNNRGSARDQNIIDNYFTINNETQVQFRKFSDYSILIACSFVLSALFVALFLTKFNNASENDSSYVILGLSLLFFCFGIALVILTVKTTRKRNMSIGTSFQLTEA